VPVFPLPPDPSFEQLRNQAKILQRVVRGGLPQALEMVREFHPRLADATADSPAVTGFTRADAQLVTARRYGFASWARLRAYMDVVARYSRAPHREPGTDLALADEFLRLACLTHGDDDPGRWRQATELLATHPGLTRASIHAAAAAGDVAATRELLDRVPANQEGGPYRWEPILYVAYSAVRAPECSHLEAARLLLDAGADPAAGYLWEGLCPPYTALTAALEQQPGQLDRLGMSAGQRGADANDSQALYELGGTDDTDALDLLFEFGLGTGDGGAWHARLAPFHPSPAQLVQEELIKAAGSNSLRRARLILSHPVDPAGLGDRHPIHEGCTAWQLAMLHGHTEMTTLLREAGHGTADPELEFLGACMRADRAEVDRLRAADPGILTRAITRRPWQISTAAGEDRLDAVMLLTELGFDVNATTRYPHQQAALHGATFRGNLAMVKYLTDHGADPSVEDCSYNATPLGWAEHFNHQAIAEYLGSLTKPRP